MSRRPELAGSDPLRVLRSLALRGSPSPTFVGPSEPGRVGPTVAGMAECTRYCARLQATHFPGFVFDVRGAAVRDVLDACWLAASPSTRQSLRVAGRAGAPLLCLDPA